MTTSLWTNCLIHWAVTIVWGVVIIALILEVRMMAKL